jgi:hypothetical protein
MTPHHARNYSGSTMVHVATPDINTPSDEHLAHNMAAAASAHKLEQLPPEMIEFTLLKTAGALAPRLGRLSLAGRKTVLTPAFIGNTSRGVIPHISQDTFRKSVDVPGVYIPLEDCT